MLAEVERAVHNKYTEDCEGDCLVRVTVKSPCLALTLL